MDGVSSVLAIIGPSLIRPRLTEQQERLGLSTLTGSSSSYWCTVSWHPSNYMVCAG